jgi:CBS domain-containing protein
LKSIPVETTIDWRSYGTMTVKQFLTDESTGQYKQPAVCITSEGTLFIAAKYMIDHHIHRVWVTSPAEVAGVQGFGIGCISLTDVIRVVSTYSTVGSNPSETA